jgi:VIT1/CCC1 family predicted Fe2+/Mn2+ transporter
VRAETSLWEKLKQSFMSAVGDIVFGMEDGTVSIFGLVFGVAASTADSKTVLLAGATGAVAAAVSMMAGTYLDVTTSQAQARTELRREQTEITQHPADEARELTQRLAAAGFTTTEQKAVVAAMQAHPDTWLQVEADFELHLGNIAQENPWVQAGWMFVADLFAGAVPVVPFAFLPIAEARVTSIVITATLLIILGVGRARVASTKLLPTIVQTVGIATAAALAGVLIGKLITR